MDAAAVGRGRGWGQLDETRETGLCKGLPPRPGGLRQDVSLSRSPFSSLLEGLNEVTPRASPTM